MSYENLEVSHPTSLQDLEHYKQNIEATPEFAAFIDVLTKEYRPRSKDELFLGQRWNFLRNIEAPEGEIFYTAIGTKAKHACLLVNEHTEEIILVSHLAAIEAFDNYRVLDKRPIRKVKYSKHTKPPPVGIYQVKSPTLEPLLSAIGKDEPVFENLARLPTDGSIISYDPFASTKDDDRMKILFLRHISKLKQNFRMYHSSLAGTMSEREMEEFIDEKVKQKIAKLKKWSPMA